MDRYVFTDAEIAEFEERAKNSGFLKYIYEKQIFTDTEVEKDWGRFGLFMLQRFERIGYVTTTITEPIITLHFREKMKQFISKMFPKMTERSGR